MRGCICVEDAEQLKAQGSLLKARDYDWNHASQIPIVKLLVKLQLNDPRQF